MSGSLCSLPNRGGSIGGHGLEGQGGKRGGSARGGGIVSRRQGGGGDSFLPPEGGKGGDLVQKFLAAVGGQIFGGFYALFVELSMFF